MLHLDYPYAGYEALTLFEQDRIPESLAVFDEATALFRTHGDDVGSAIGRMGPCALLARFDEALERARRHAPSSKRPASTPM